MKSLLLSLLFLLIGVALLVLGIYLLRKLHRRTLSKREKFFSILGDLISIVLDVVLNDFGWMSKSTGALLLLIIGFFMSIFSTLSLIETIVTLVSAS